MQIVTWQFRLRKAARVVLDQIWRAAVFATVWVIVAHYIGRLTGWTK